MGPKSDDEHPRSGINVGRGSTEDQPSPVEAVSAASVALFRGASVLLVRRRQGVAAGLWSLPGGHVEVGESAEAAARRELHEETGMTVGALRHCAVHEVHVTSDSDGRERCYEIEVFCGAAPPGTPVAASDAAEARFVDLEELARLPLTIGALSLIRRAHTVTRGGD